MASALIIGIGSSGLHIIEEAQQFYYELTGKNKPAGVEYFYIETDKDEISKNTASGTSDINSLFITLRNNEATINDLKDSNNPDTLWIPSPESVLNNEKGAGGMSSYGRLALWGNFNKVRDFIVSKYQKINGNSETVIFIVGTLTGGTGSGLCVDIPYLVRESTQNNNIFGIFLTPDRHSIKDPTNSKLFINYINSIASIEKFSKEKHPAFKINWPGAGVFTDKRPPYSHVQLISQDFDNANAPIANVPQLKRIAGLNLMTRFLGLDQKDAENKPIETYSSVYDRRVMTDAKPSLSKHNNTFSFSTLGVSLIQYPKSQMEELFAIGLSETIIKRWLDPLNYEDNTHNIIPITTYPDLKGETEKEFEKDLENCFEMIDAIKVSDNQTFKHTIEIIASNIMTKNYEGKATPNSYVMDRFASNNTHNLYQIISNNSISIRTELIESIQNRIVIFTEKYQNIKLCENKIDELIKEIDSIIKYWSEKYKINSDSTKWNGLLTAQIKSVLETTTLYYITNQKKNYIEEQLNNILTLLKMHTSIKTLVEIRDSLQQPTNYLRSNSKKIELPSLKRLDEFKTNLKNTLDNQTTRPSINRRKADLEFDLKNNTNQIIRLFKNGSLESDLEYAETEYNRGTNKINLSVFTNNKPLWVYLLENNDTIYKDFLARSKKFVENNNLVSNIGIIDLIESIKPTEDQYSKIETYINGSKDKIIQNLPAMIHLNRNTCKFEQHSSLTTIILSSNINELRRSVEYKAEDDDESVNLPELKNAIIYCQEYGYMGVSKEKAKVFQPLLHIGYNKTIVNNILKPSIKNEGEVFYEKRIPYLSVEEFDKVQEEILNY